MCKMTIQNICCQQPQSKNISLCLSLHKPILIEPHHAVSYFFHCRLRAFRFILFQCHSKLFGLSSRRSQQPINLSSWRVPFETQRRFIVSLIRCSTIAAFSHWSPPSSALRHSTRGSVSGCSFATGFIFQCKICKFIQSFQDGLSVSSGHTKIQISHMATRASKPNMEGVRCAQAGLTKFHEMRTLF